MATDERVLCFESRLLDRIGPFQGLSLDVDRYLPVVTDAANLVYRLRSETETDPRYKQLIPYVLIVADRKILRYQRGTGGGESRLHGLYSIGVGGHIADVDQDLFATDAAGYQNGMRREIREEVDVEPVSEAAVAVINDDSTEVGTVHFGVVHVMRVENEYVIGRRLGIRAPEFVELAAVMNDRDGYETWSQLCIDRLDDLLSASTPPALPGDSGA